MLADNAVEPVFVRNLQHLVDCVCAAAAQQFNALGKQQHTVNKLSVNRCRSSLSAGCTERGSGFAHVAARHDIDQPEKTPQHGKTGLLYGHGLVGEPVGCGIKRIRRPVLEPGKTEFHPHPTLLHCINTS